jgi:hypothetical protein
MRGIMLFADVSGQRCIKWRPTDLVGRGSHWCQQRDWRLCRACFRGVHGHHQRLSSCCERQRWHCRCLGCSTIQQWHDKHRGNGSCHRCHGTAPGWPWGCHGAVCWQHEQWCRREPYHHRWRVLLGQQLWWKRACVVRQWVSLCRCHQRGKCWCYLNGCVRTSATNHR